MCHIVWIPRYRYRVLVGGVRQYLMIRLDEFRRYYPDIEYVERHVQSDYFHLVVSFPLKYCMARVVQIMKANTGRALRAKFDFLRERYYGKGGVWSVGYFVSTVGLDEDMIKRYVRYQEKKDLGKRRLHSNKPRAYARGDLLCPS